MKVLIGTNNPGKIEGAKQAFEKFYKNVGQCRNKFGIIKTSKEIITLEKKKGESL